MDLRTTQLKDTYGNLVTTGTTEGAPTEGGLQNGQGTLLTSVGIGTNTPAEPFDLQMDSISGLKIGTNADGGATLTTYQGSNNSNVRQFQINCQNFEVNTGSPTGTSTSNALLVDSSGNVGIGATSVSSNFRTEIAGGDFRVGDTQGEDAVEIGWSAGGSQGFVQAYDRGDSAFRDLMLNNSLLIKSGGKVGIGETSPSAKLEITGTDTEPLTVLNDTVYTFAGNVTTSQSNTHTVTIPFTSQGSHHSNFIVEIYASLSWGTGTSTPYAGRALYTFNTFTSINNITELEDNGQNLSFAGTYSGMDFIVTITTTASSGQEPDRIGVMAKVIRGNGSVGNEPTSMTIA